MKTFDKKYPFALIAAPIIGLLTALSINFLMDPYQIFTSEVNAIYSQKPALHPNLRMHKAYQVKLQKPDTLIMGTSKAIQGFPLYHASFHEKHLYNLAAPLASMKENYYLLQHAQANNPIKDVILAIDFLSFNSLARTDGPAAGFVEARLDKPNEKKSRYMQDYISALASWDALSETFHSLFISRDSTHRVLNGFGGRENNEIISRLSDGGHRSNTISIEGFFINAVYLSAPYRRFDFTKGSEDSFQWYEKYLDIIYTNNINAKFAISPSHARLWELIHTAGLWPQYEQWKRRLVAINETLSKKHNKPAIALWDFSAVNRITSEEFPEAGDVNTRMDYYYEAVHFSQRTGRLVLDKMMGYQSQEDVPENFGIRLTGETVNETLDALRLGQHHYRLQHPEYVEELRNAIPDGLLHDGIPAMQAAL